MASKTLPQENLEFKFFTNLLVTTTFLNFGEIYRRSYNKDIEIVHISPCIYLSIHDLCLLV